MFRNTKSIDDLEQNKFITIGKVIDYSGGRNGGHFKCWYYYRGHKYYVTANASGYQENDCLDKYFEIKLSTLNPNNSELMLERQISDSTRIKEFETELFEEKETERQKYFD